MIDLEGDGDFPDPEIGPHAPAVTERDRYVEPAPKFEPRYVSRHEKALKTSRDFAPWKVMEEYRKDRR